MDSLDVAFIIYLLYVTNIGEDNPGKSDYTILFLPQTLKQSSFLESSIISCSIFLLVMRAYIWVVLILVCPNIFDTDSIGTPLLSVIVANVCRARWKLSSSASDFRIE